MTHYITVDPKSLTIAIHDRQPGADGFIIAPDPLDQNYSNQVARDLLFDILEEAVRRRQGAKAKDVEFCLAPADPWLVVIATVMRDGILQGLAWDVVKLAVGAAMARLRDANLAPPSKSPGNSELERIGFVWTEYTGDDEQHEVFIGLTRKYGPPARRAAARSRKSKAAGPAKSKAKNSRSRKNKRRK